MPRLYSKKAWPLILVLMVFIGTGCSFMQSVSQKGQTYFERGEYEWAIQTLKPLAAKNALDNQSTYIIGESYRLSNRINLALPYLEKALQAGIPDDLIAYHIAIAAKSTGDYAKAKSYLEKFLLSKPSRPNQIKAELELENLSKIPELTNQKSLVQVYPINGNTVQTEFAPVIQGKNLLFTSSSKPLIYKNNGLPFLGLVTAPLKSDLEIGTPSLFSEKIYLENANDGTPAFTHDGKKMVFARGNTGKKDVSPDVDLFISTKIGDNWTTPERLAISDSIAWDGSPCFSSDDRTLYFSSNRRGGKGGLDLYRVNIDNSGRFGRPINMGSTINTPGDEAFPQVSDAGKLYFASDGHPSIGGLDLYVASRNENEIVVEHLGAPINSIGDDFAICFADSTSGYFSSNRPGGKGDDDIYYFKSPQSENTWWGVEIPEKPKESPTPKSIAYHLKTRVIDLAGQAIPGASVSIKRDNEEAQVFSSNKQGYLPIFDLQETDELNFKGSKETYLTIRNSFSMQGRIIPINKLTKEHTDTTYTFDLAMDQPELGQEISQLYGINSIYYNVNKSDIRPDAAEELDKVVYFLNDNPQINLELGAHTDARSSKAYNQKLSQVRAESAVNYIVAKGISPTRIKPKGYGESQLLNGCVDGVDCPEEMHQQNRRTEFRITQIKID
jgi:outer membrane protein OmpA-like peptidoglycan-associated protein